MVDLSIFLSKKKRGKWNKEMKIAKRELEDLSKENDPTCWKELKEVENKINCLNKKEEQYWRQRSRALLLKKW